MNHNRELELYTEIISTIRQFPSYYDSLLNGNAGNGFRNACDWICNYGVTHSFRVHFSRKGEKKSDLTTVGMYATHTGLKSVTTFDRGYLGHDCRENERVIKLFFK